MAFLRWQITLKGFTMQTKQKNKAKPLIEKPFLTGQPADGLTVKRALSVLGTIVTSMFIYLVVGPIFVADNLIVRILIALLFEGMFVAFCYSNGVNAGFKDVTFSEIAYQRRESGRPLDTAEEAKCFHRQKGFISALIGTAPLFILAVALAVFTKPQWYTISALPSWIEGLERRTEIGNALAFYHSGLNIGVVDIVRIVVRLAVMPFVTLVGAENVLGTLMIERLSPVLLLLPGIGYALGYLRGPKVRKRVLSDIAVNERKKKKREKKRLQQNRKGPEQLV